MTKQLTIKLNEKNFAPVFEKLRTAGKGLFSSNSEIAGFCVFYVNQMLTERLPELDNKTRADYLLHKRGYTGENALLDWLKDFRKFLKKKGFE